MFGKAQMANLLALVLSLVKSFVDNQYLSLATAVASFCVMLFIFNGISHLAERLNDYSTCKRCKLVRSMMIVLVISPIVLGLLAAVASKGRGSGATYLVLLVGGILLLLLITYVLYLCLLHQAKTMLSNAKAEAWDPLAGAPDEFLPGNSQSNPW